ncbi:TlpA family protein disulfide reductase [Marivirga harenae]|uniref:TlpA family protein disulfide reductase n=1 Tax=Marivirga harenae TaxID=2010992 RepID=UPI0026DF2CED|nr:redoxin domain-containing protein [Marivirga harenae]WKV11465.1 redoxin domain-containing protein [Marivirga harenae]
MEKEITPIPSIKVQDFGYNELNLLEKYKGKPLVIIIYNNQCLGCTGRAIPLAYEYQKEYADLQVIGIHSIFNKKPVTEDDIKSIFTTQELPFPIYLDQNHQVYDQFESEGTPQWLLITAEGILYRSIFGSQLGAQNRLMYALDALCNEG